MKRSFFQNKYFVWAILLLGIILRVIYLGVIPGGYHRDEAYAAWNALSLYKDGIDSAGHSYPVYFEAWAHGQNALNSYLMIPLIALAGGHVTPLVVRLPQVTVSILTLTAVYFMMKRMFSYRIAVWALFLTAICPWHLMMSRWGLESNLAPGFLILGLYCWVKGLDKPAWFLLSALCYGLSLYSYATIWPIVPLIVLLQLGYGMVMKRMKWSWWLTGAGALLCLMGLPLILFLFVNMGVIDELQIGCFSIYRMTLFRANELAHSLGQVWANIRNLGYLLKNQDVGRPYDVIMPYGFFYDVGRVLIVIGTAVMLIRLMKGLKGQSFAYEWFLLVQLMAAAVVACLITVTMTQINCLYLPLVLCEAIGADAVCQMAGKLWEWAAVAVGRKHERAMPEAVGSQKKRALSEALGGQSSMAAAVVAGVLTVVYLVNLAGFQYVYYTDYRSLASANFQEGADEAVRYAWKYAGEMDCDISVNPGLKYPNVLLATETGAREYLDTLIYSENLPAPSQFSCNQVVFYMDIDFEHLQDHMIYVIYYTDLEYFEAYELTKFCDWYVAIPKQ